MRIIQRFVKSIHTAKTLGFTLTTFLGCLSYINVTKEWYQIEKASLVTLVSEDLFGNIPGISTTYHAIKELQGMQMCVRSKQQHTSPEMLIYKFSEKLYILTKRETPQLYSDCKQLFACHAHKGNATKVTKIWLK